MNKQSSTPGFVHQVVKTLLTQRAALLGVLIVVVLAGLTALDLAGNLTGSYDADYLATALITAVPMVMLGFAQLIVILSGKGGIDLSVGAVVSLANMAFGYTYGVMELGLFASLLVTVLVGALCGAVNGTLVAHLGFPPLIATLATFYALKSLAMVLSGQRPISTRPIQELYALARPVEIPIIGASLPDVPLAIFTFLVPTVVVMWLLLNRTSYGRRAYAIGTNDEAAQWAGINTRTTRLMAYVIAGVLSSLVAVVVVAQFASARPDAGTAGSGMSLPRGPRVRQAGCRLRLHAGAGREPGGLNIHDGKGTGVLERSRSGWSGPRGKSAPTLPTRSSWRWALRARSAPPDAPSQR